MNVYSSLHSSLPTLDDDVVITILPSHANNIYEGHKRVEFRKVLPRVVPRRMYLYETGPRRHISGHIVVSKVFSGALDSIWKSVEGRATSKIGFDRYFARRSNGVAFAIQDSVRYEEPMDLARIREIEAGFRVPQNFLYLENLPRLKLALRQLCLRESMRVRIDEVDLRDLSKGQEQSFTKLVKEHISGSYLETGEEYARELIRIHQKPVDVEGVLTLNKRIYEIRNRLKAIGFVVLTEKVGGSVKSGPVVLKEGSQRKGIGGKLRQLLKLGLGRAGFRKIYCTVPATHDIGRSYLLKSGYRLEAHLVRQYHGDHDEFVFGLRLTNERSTAVEVIRQIEPIEKYQRLEKRSMDVARFLAEEFTETFCAVPRDWAETQVARAAEWAKGKRGAFRDRVIYTGRSAGLLVVGLCVIKRGGSCKIVLLTRTGHRKSLTEFLRYIERSLAGAKLTRIRKLYSHVTIGDTDALGAFYDSEFRPEGILERPFNDRTDMIVLSKVL